MTNYHFHISSCNSALDVDDKSQTVSLFACGPHGDTLNDILSTHVITDFYRTRSASFTGACAATRASRTWTQDYCPAQTNELNPLSLSGENCKNGIFFRVSAIESHAWV